MKRNDLIVFKTGRFRSWMAQYIDITKPIYFIRRDRGGDMWVSNSKGTMVNACCIGIAKIELASSIRIGGE